MTTTPDTERRERYAAVLNPMEHYTADDGYGAMAVRTPEELADAAMAVADRELTQVREELDDANGDIAKMQRDIARLRKQAAEVRAAAFDEAADKLAQQADALWAPGRPAHTVMHADADELRRMAAAARPDNTTGA